MEERDLLDEPGSEQIDRETIHGVAKQLLAIAILLAAILGLLYVIGHVKPAFAQNQQCTTYDFFCFLFHGFLTTLTLLGITGTTLVVISIIVFFWFKISSDIPI